MRGWLVVVLLIPAAATARPWRPPLHWSRERGAMAELEAGYGGGVVMRPTHTGEPDLLAGTGVVASASAGYFAAPNFTMALRATALTLDGAAAGKTTLGMLGLSTRVAFTRFSAGAWAGYSLGLGYAYTHDVEHTSLGVVSEVRFGYVAPSTSRNALSIAATLGSGILSSGYVYTLGVTIMYQRS